MVVAYLDFAPCAVIGYKMQVVYKELTRDRVKSNEAKSEYDWWKTSKHVRMTNKCIQILVFHFSVR